MAERPNNTVVGHIKNGFLARMMRFSPPAIVTWLALVNRADSAGRCYPSISTLQHDTSLSRATVFRAIKELAASNEIGVISGGNDGKAHSQYQITGGLTFELVQNRDPSISETEGSHNETPGVSRLNSNHTHITKHKNQTVKSRFEYSKEYEAFWLTVAPHKRDKKADGFRRYKEAVAILKARDGIGEPHAFLLEKAKAYYSSPLGHTPFCNGPAPWLHQGGYDADPASWQRGDKNGQVNPQEPIRYRG